MKNDISDFTLYVLLTILFLSVLVSLVVGVLVEKIELDVQTYFVIFSIAIIFIMCAGLTIWEYRLKRRSQNQNPEPNSSGQAPKS